MRLFTLAFLFDPSYSRVLLIHKKRPDWQAGKLNGIGGKLESEETPLAGIVREIREETNLKIDAGLLRRFAQLHGHDWQVEVFASTVSGQEAKQMTDEEIEWVNISAIPPHAIVNLTWLIPMAIDRLKNGSPCVVRVYYQDHP